MANVANVGLQPILARGVSNMSESTPGGSKPFSMDTNALDDVYVHMPQDLPAENVVWRFFARQDGRRLGHPHT